MQGGQQTPAGQQQQETPFDKAQKKILASLPEGKKDIKDNVEKASDWDELSPVIGGAPKNQVEALGEKAGLSITVQEKRRLSRTAIVNRLDEEIFKVTG